MKEELSIKNRPNFYGYWVTNEGESSIFFMNLVEEQGNIGGDIEDKLGNGLFIGARDKDKIEFDKTYTRPVSQLANRHTLSYKGYKIKGLDNFYEGTYCINIDKSNTLGTFILQPFPDSATMDSLVENLRKKLL